MNNFVFKIVFYFGIVALAMTARFKPTLHSSTNQSVEFVIYFTCVQNPGHLSLVAAATPSLKRQAFCH